VPGSSADPDAASIRANVEALLTAYREVDRASLLLPALGSTEGWDAWLIAPISLMWDRLKSYLTMLRDVRKASSASESFHRVATWFIGDFGPIRGEALLGTAVVSRPLVSSLLAAHFRRRLSLLKRWLLLGGSDPNQDLLDQIDDALSIWRTRRTISGAVTFVVTLAGAVGGFVSIAHGAEGMPWWGWLLIGFAIYVIYLVVVGSFIAKRGLMLARSADAAYRPASVRESGTYGVERTLFAPLKIKRAEIPLDLVLSGLFLTLGAAFMFAIHLAVLGAILVATVVLTACAYWRRRRLKRL
jgi:hypothetical protein